MNDYLRRLSYTPAPMPPYPWPNPENAEIKRLKAENMRLREENEALRRGQGNYEGKQS